LTRTGAISAELMTMLEAIPTSYMVIANQSILPERTTDYEAFWRAQLPRGRLRFIRRFDGHDDLYAVVKNEPEAKK